MANENLLPFDPNKVPDLIKQGKIRVVTTPTISAASPAHEAPGGNQMIEWARDLFKEKFFGAEAVEKAFGVSLNQDQTPDVADFFSQEELQRAKELGQRLILRVDKAADGKLLTMEKMQAELQPEFDLDPEKGNILFNIRWYKDEPFYKTDMPIVKWALVSDGVIDDTADAAKSTKGKNYLQQTQILANYLMSTVFAGQSLPPRYQAAINEFNSKKGALDTAMREALAGAGYWEKLATDLSGLQLNKLLRQTPVEVLYDMLLILQNTNKRLLPDEWTWTNGQAQSGRLVGVGYSDAGGADVDGWWPGISNLNRGVVLSR